ncbi:MAG: DUF167 domain-containing protein [Planctomycetaceae bacterium]|nr:DUF167 domain-containing protein [Planctomycetaceae bacterium]
MAEAEVLVEAWEDGASFHIKAHAGARRDAVGGCHDGMLRVETTTAPEKGKANKSIAKLLAKRLGVPASAVVLLSGETNSRKRFGVRGVTPDQIRAALQ